MGCYIRIPIKIQDVKKVKYVDELGKTKKTKFCPNTGKEYREEVYFEEEKIFPHAYIEDAPGLDEDMFYSPEFSPHPDKFAYLMLNMHDDEVRMRPDHSDDSWEVDLTEGVDVKGYIERFCEKYSKYIEYYQNKYGEVEIRFGLVTYWS